MAFFQYSIYSQYSLNGEEPHGHDWPPLLGHPTDPPFESAEPANTATTCTPESTSPTARVDTMDEVHVREEPHRQESDQPTVPDTPPQQKPVDSESPKLETTKDPPSAAEATQGSSDDVEEEAAQKVEAVPAEPEEVAPELPEPEPAASTGPAESAQPAEAAKAEPEPKPAEPEPAPAEPEPAPAEPEPKTAEPEPKPAETEPTPEKPQIDHEAVRAAAEKGAEILSGLTKFLEYEVREAVEVHECPDSRSPSLGSLAPGQVVHGYPGSGWLRLKPSGSVRGWVHIGRSLAVQCLHPHIRTRYLEGVEVAWPGFKGLLKPDVKVVYIVEWRCKKSGAAGHAVCHKPHEVVSNMPPGKAFELHVAVRIRGPASPAVDAAPEVRFAGLWIESHTLQLKQGDEVEEAESCMDPFGTARGGCLNCQCYGFLWRPGLEDCSTYMCITLISDSPDDDTDPVRELCSYMESLSGIPAHGVYQCTA